MAVSREHIVLCGKGFRVYEEDRKLLISEYFKP